MVLVVVVAMLRSTLVVLLFVWTDGESKTEFTRTSFCVIFDKKRVLDNENSVPKNKICHQRNA